MDAVKTYVITVIACVMVSSLVLAISPEGAIKKHLRFLLGVVFTAVLLTPLANGAFNGISIPEMVYGDAAANAGTDIKSFMARQALDLFENRIKSAASEASGVPADKISVVISKNGEVEKITLYGAQPYQGDKVSARLGLQRDKIVTER